MAEAAGELAAAQAAVFEAAIPLQMFAAEIVVDSLTKELEAKKGALVALEEAAAVPAL